MTEPCLIDHVDAAELAAAVLDLPEIKTDEDIDTVADAFFDEFYFPKEWRGKPENAKQGSSGIVKLDWFDLEGTIKEAFLAYTILLQQGVAPEQARMVLPQNTMTEWIWSGSLYAFARVCNLRLDSHAQLETQEVAKEIYSCLKALYPVSTEALIESVN